MIGHLTNVFQDGLRDFEATLAECHGEDDHVHLLVAFPPNVQVSRLVNALMGVSGRMLLQKNYQVRTHQDHLWGPSYLAASRGGARLTTIRQYVQSQSSSD